MASWWHAVAWSALHAAFLMHVALLDLLRWLRIRARRVWTDQIQLVGQQPAHLGVVFAKDEICIERIADLVAWCAEAGIGCITLCDGDGLLQSAEAELSLALRARSVAIKPRADGASDSAGLALRVVTLQTGRDELVDAARAFCKQTLGRLLPVEAIDEAAIDRYLATSYESPELVPLLALCPWA